MLISQLQNDIQLKEGTYMCCLYLDISLSVLVPYSTWSIGLFIVSFHLFLSMATLAASAHILNPILHLSLKLTVLPRFLSDDLSSSSLLVPMLAQFLVTNLVSFSIITCPIHLHLRVYSFRSCSLSNFFICYMYFHF